MTHTTPDTPSHSPTSRAVLRWGTLLLILLAWAYALFGTEGILRQRQRREELTSLKAQLEQEKQQNALLATEVEGLQHNGLTKEKAIRDTLDYQKPGEIVLLVEEDDPLQPKRPAPES